MTDHESTTICNATPAGGEATSTSTPGSRIGILGFGTIASAIATGLLSQNEVPIEHVTVTKRSEKKSTKLKNDFADRVTVIGVEGPSGHQQVVDAADIVFLCVLPQQVDEVLKGVILDSKRHKLVSLVSTADLNTLRGLSKLPEENVYKMICLPRVAKLQGTCLLTPKGDNKHIPALCRSLGGVVECESEDVMRTMMVMTGLMGPMYAIARTNRDWLVSKGVPAEDANVFISRTYLSVIQDATEESDNPQRFDELVKEQTPGGLNEQAIRNLESQGVFDAYASSMDAMLKRLEGKSDGFVASDK